MDYCGIFSSALAQVLEALNAGRITVTTEADLRAWLFSACAERLTTGQSESVVLHAEYPIGGQKADLVLGPGPDLAAELKFDPPKGNSLFLKESGGSHNIQSDLKKIERYSKRGICGHFVMVEMDVGTDEDYYWPKYTDVIGLPRAEWKQEKRFAWIHQEVTRKPPATVQES